MTDDFVDDELLRGLWEADERFLAIVLMAERGGREHGLDWSRDQVVAAVYRALIAWQREVGKRPGVRAQVVAEAHKEFGPREESEAELAEFVERRLFEIARERLDVHDLLAAIVFDLTGIVDLFGAEWLSGGES